MAFSIHPGVFPTMITPFTEDNRLDYAEIRRLVEYYVRSGCAGIFAVCQSSEMFFLSEEEKKDLLSAVLDAAAGRVQVVASGHTAAELSAQIDQLGMMAQAGAEAVVLVPNRLAAPDEDDETLLSRMRQIFDALPDVTFGVYECPYPYKRLCSPEVMRFMARSGRVAFMKDTCCNLAQIEEKQKAAAGSALKIFNANTATLLDSLRAGCQGFSGVMANFHAELYVELIRRLQYPEADELQAFLTAASWSESRPYPITAKYHLRLMGHRAELVCRCRPASDWNETAASEMRQLALLEDMWREKLGVTVSLRSV